jgi:hypothetical protein
MMWFTKESAGFRGWLTVIRLGVLRTGLTAGSFTITVVSPGDSAKTILTATESIQKPGAYHFDVPNTFLLAGGVGEYVVVVEVNTPPPNIKDVVSSVMRVTEKDFDDLLEPGGTVEIGATSIDAIRTAVMTHIVNSNILNLTLEQTVDLMRKVLNNRLELSPGDEENWILFDDDDVSQLLVYDVTDKDGDAIEVIAATPARRTRGI